MSCGGLAFLGRFGVVPYSFNLITMDLIVLRGTFSILSYNLIILSKLHFVTNLFKESLQTLGLQTLGPFTTAAHRIT